MEHIKPMLKVCRRCPGFLRTTGNYMGKRMLFYQCPCSTQCVSSDAFWDYDAPLNCTSLMELVVLGQERKK